MMTPEERKAFMEAAWGLTKSINNTQIEKVQQFVDETGEKLKANWTSEELSKHTISELQLNAYDNKFFYDIGNLILEIHKTFADYKEGRETVASRVQH